MSSPNRETVAEIAPSTGITTQALYNWRAQWWEAGQLVPASGKPPEQCSAADILPAVIQAAGPSGGDLGAYCPQLGLSHRHFARSRQAAEAANNLGAPNMTDIKDLQRNNNELIRHNRKLERELQKKEKALSEAATLL